MNLVNGFIIGLLDNGAGLDENGDPALLPKVWSDPIPANIQANTQDSRGTNEGGRFTTAQYTVLIHGKSFGFTHARLELECGRDLGEFTVQGVEILKFVERVKITV